MPRGKRKPRLVTDKDRARVAELHAQGLSRNAIAKAMDRPWSTITKIAKEQGLLFDRSATRAAVEARKIDLAALRAVEAEATIVDARRLRERAWSAYTVVVGGREGAEIVNLELPPLTEVRNAYAAYGIAIDKHMTLARFDSTTDDGASIDKFLAHLAGK